MTQIEEDIIINIQKLPLKNIMNFFSFPFYHPVFFLVIYFFYYKYFDQNNYIFFNFIILEALIWGIKLMVNRNRPYENNNQIKNLDYYMPFNKSFPSGHAFASWYISYYIGTKYDISNWYIYPLLVGLSRIHLGVHYPSDVISGFIIAQLSIESLKHFNLIF